LKGNKILEGMYMAGSLTKVVEGHVLTSMLNTRDEEVEVMEEVAKLEETVEGGEVRAAHTKKGGAKRRNEEVLEQLRTEHLNPEERESRSKICSEYPDVFYLPGDQPSSTNTIKHTIRDIEKTAFSTKSGHWAYRRLPLGLKTAPATFKRMLNTVLSGLTGTRCFAFLDIVVYAKLLAEHHLKLREIFERLRQYKLKPEKCKFLRKEVSYLGHVIIENGVRPDPTRPRSTP
jgi:hypothetical protein